MRILVTGAGGYIGSFLCKRLLEKGYSIIGLGLAKHLNRLRGIGCEVLLHDLSAKEELKLPSLDAVIYLAQSSFYREMPEKALNLFEVNVCGLIKIAESVRNSGIKKFIYASTGNVYKPSLKPLSENSPLRKDDFYALSKITAENVLNLYSKYFEVIVARLFTVYGPKQSNMLIPKVIDKVKSGEAIFLEPIDSNDLNNEGLLLTPCYIEDAITILEELLNKEIKRSLTINVAGPQVVSIKQIAKEVGKILEKAPVFSNSSNYRKGNLIANTSLLESIVKISTTAFSEGIRKTLANEVSE